MKVVVVVYNLIGVEWIWVCYVSFDFWWWWYVVYDVLYGGDRFVGL